MGYTSRNVPLKTRAVKSGENPLHKKIVYVRIHRKKRNAMNESSSKPWLQFQREIRPVKGFQHMVMRITLRSIMLKQSRHRRQPPVTAAVFIEVNSFQAIKPSKMFLCFAWLSLRIKVVPRAFSSLKD